jgi:O-acetyl-ADP-ribose deacetylase (regulator of RNase III)
MNIEVRKEDLGDYSLDMGGECACANVEIIIDKRLSPRQQRSRVIHAVIENYCRSWSHDKVDELEELIMEALDKLNE